ncbi:MAG TPA: cupin domain-containing protein [Candidatus Acidoferrales bacterium]|nr:cupin domain-containing protein [Candidatus Acidoferrales bacterium]
MANPPPRYNKPRVFVRSVESMTYGLAEMRRQRLATIPRVISCDYRDCIGEGAVEKSLVSPGKEPFLTQSLHCHFVTVAPGGRDKGHGHQNEAFFYILQGRGFDMHDGVRYDWEAGDAVAVHNDSVHWHNNPDPEQPFVALVMKAKPTWLFLGLHQQGPIGTVAPDDGRWGPPVEWAIARAPEDVRLKKVIKPADTPWRTTPHGRVRLLADATVPLRIKAVDVHLQEIPAGSRSGKQWQMADEIFYVLEGRGYDLHWDVEVDITDKYYARIAKQPSRWEWKEGDLVYIPQNTIHQHFNADPAKPARFIAGSNRLYKMIGYARIEQLENAPEYNGEN